MAVRAYEIADAFRSRGKTVVMGGFHASNLPDEALGHVDAVVVGIVDTVDVLNHKIYPAKK